jgi:hypothetical protein
VLRYTPSVDGSLTIDVGSGSVGASTSCITTPTCIGFTDIVGIRAGVEILLSVEGDAGTTATFTLTEVPSLVEGAACTIVQTFNVGAVEKCDFADGQYCAGAAGCSIAERLVFDTPLEFTSVAGTRLETCYSFSGPGSFALRTDGACSAGNLNDTVVRVFSNGLQIAVNDDVAPLVDNRCSAVEVTLPAGEYLGCVAHFGFDGVTNGVTFTATQQ